MVNEYLLECKGITKSFGPTKAVANVDFNLVRGEIRGLIGENGSGKSTLCAMITGMLNMDAGNMQFKGKKFAPSSLLDAKKVGISILLQETGTISGMSVAENIFLGKEHLFCSYGTLNKKKMFEQAQKEIDKIGLFVSSKDRIDRLSFEDRKLIEVVRSMFDDPDLLIVDETTTALSQYGREKIYAILRQMKEENKSVIFITHDMSEMMGVCDSVTVLRDGCYIDTILKKDFSEDRIRQCMIGRDLSGSYYRDNSSEECEENADTVLEVSNVSYGNTVKKVSFQLKEGEILGIGGLTDCGMHDLGQLLFGALKIDEGHILHKATGETIVSPEQSIRLGIAYLPKDRDQASLFLSSSIRDNVTMAATDKLMNHGLLSVKKEKALAKEQTAELAVRMQGINQLVRALSGGNKQKVAVAKWLANDSSILIMDCPTRGIDIGVKQAIYHLMEKLKEAKKSIIMISEELPELIGMSDRLLIMKDGKVNAEFFRSGSMVEKEIIKKMI